MALSLGLPNVDFGFILLNYVVFIFSLTLHEVGHAWTSELFGDPTGRYMGRITLNPLAHMDPIGTVLLPLAAMIYGTPFFGWAKPVPVNPLLWRDKLKANIAVSAAGPAANVLIALATIIVIKALNYSQVNLGSLNEPVAIILQQALLINIVLAVFNMLPIPPLDGSHIFSSLLSVISPNLMESYESLRPYGYLILLGLMFTGVFGYILMPVINLAIMLIQL